MLVRDCAGGVVFFEDDVFMLENEKGEWVLPKGRIRQDMLSTETALQRVKAEAGIDAEIISPAGETSYEFFSVTRKRPVYNKVNWYIMQAKNGEYSINQELQFSAGAYLPVNQAIERATYSQDKGLISFAYRKYREFRGE